MGETSSRWEAHLGVGQNLGLGPHLETEPQKIRLGEGAIVARGVLYP